MQAWESPEQGGGGGWMGAQVPELHVSVARQHGSRRQEAPVAAHCEMLRLQVPLVSVAFTFSQVSPVPVQQSSVTVQLAPSGWHAFTHVPPEQEPEQQFEFVEQVLPTGEQFSPHVPEMQLPKQHGVDGPHAWPP